MSIPFDVRTELYINSAWVDITDSVRREERIIITRGRPSQGSQVEPTTCTLTLDNRDGKFSPRNPSGPYYGQFGRNTPLRVFVRAATDTFGRTVSNGWDKADTGQVWSFGDLAGTVTAADFSVAAGEGIHSVPSSNAIRMTYLAGEAYGDVDLTVDARLNVSSPTGASVSFGVMVRGQDDLNDNYVQARLTVPQNASATAEIVERSGGTPVATASVGTMTNLNTIPVRFRVLVEGQIVRLKVWRTNTAEPTAWTVTGKVPGSLQPGWIGVRSFVATGNTNTKPVLFYWDNLTVRLPRFCGEVAEWPVQWDLSGSDVETTVVAAGILRRIGRGASSLPSAPRAWTPAATNLRAYWPMESGRSVDSVPATQAAIPPLRPYVGSHPGGLVSVPPVWGTGDLAPWLAPVVSRARSTGMTVLAAQLPFTLATAWTVDEIVAGDNINANIDVSPAYLGGGLVWPQLTFNPTANQLELVLFGSTTVAGAPQVFDGQPHHVRWRMLQSGGNVQYWVYVDGATVLSGSVVGTLPAMQSIGLVANSGSSFSQGHVAIWGGLPSTDNAVSVAFGWRGETAAARISRLCLEQGVSLLVAGASSEAVAVGPQTTDSLLHNLQDAADADMGILYESRAEPYLIYRTRASLYNQPTVAAFSYNTRGHIGEPFRPTDDDRNVRNDVTITRRDGLPGQVVLETGPLSVLPPPAGVGRYAERATLALAYDADAVHAAGWRVRLGTWDEARFEQVRSALLAAPSLMPAVTGLDLGGRFTVSSLPAWLWPGIVDEIVDGYTETLGEVDWDLTFNASPAKPWDVLEIDTGGERSRLHFDGQTLAAAVSSDAGSISVATAAGKPLITTSPTDMGFTVVIAGAELTVSAVSGSSSPQTLTTTLANGAVKTLPAGSAVELASGHALAM